MHRFHSAMFATFRRLVITAGVAGLMASALPAPAAAADAKSDARLAFYVLRPMDLVKVLVFQEPDMERELRVSQDHTIVMPLIGVVDVRNRTIRDVELKVEELYRRDYLVNPQVNITVLEYAQRTVNVFGAVNTPGAVQVPPEKDFTLLDAIARAGGFSRLANRSRVSLTRTKANGQTENFAINTDQLVSGDSANRWLLQDGDVIFIPERIL
jgi:polysaccharide biosynthesis/export protein